MEHRVEAANVIVKEESDCASRMLAHLKDDTPRYPIYSIFYCNIRAKDNARVRVLLRHTRIPCSLLILQLRKMVAWSRGEFVDSP
jgi:hypothetical protein